MDELGDVAPFANPINVTDNMTQAVLGRAVLCAYEENRAHTEQVFRLLCPPEFFISNITFARVDKKPYCRWIVDYKFVDPILPYDYATTSRSVWRQLDITPTNARIVDKQCINDQVNQAWRMEFGVRKSTCKCGKYFKYEMTLPGMDKKRIDEDDYNLYNVTRKLEEL